VGDPVQDVAGTLEDVVRGDGDPGSIPHLPGGPTIAAHRPPRGAARGVEAGCQPGAGLDPRTRQAACLLVPRARRLHHPMAANRRHRKGQVLQAQLEGGADRTVAAVGRRVDGAPQGVRRDAAEAEPPALPVPAAPLETSHPQVPAAAQFASAKRTPRIEPGSSAREAGSRSTPQRYPRQILSTVASPRPSLLAIAR
jgi:hypothetical protein